MIWVNFIVNSLNAFAGKEGKQISLGTDWWMKVKPTDNGKSTTFIVTNDPKARAGK